MRASRGIATNDPAKRTIPLDLRPALAHLRPDKHTSIRLEGVPEDMWLSAGSSDDGNVWSLTVAELDDLSVIVPVEYSGQSPLSVNLVRRDPRRGQLETVSIFGVLLTPDGAMSAFNGLEPDDRDRSPDSVIRLRSSVGKGRGRLAVKAGKRPLDFGDRHASAAFVAQRSTEHLNAVLRGELAYDDGITSEASLHIDQRFSVARTAWEYEAAQRLADARQAWEAERVQLTHRLNDLESQLQQAMDEIKRVHDDRRDWQGNVRTKLIEVVTRLNDEHAAELAEIEQRLKDEAERMLTTARAEWEGQS